MEAKSSSSNLMSNLKLIESEDVLTEILLRVPAKPLICLKLVSKQWLSLITSKRFSLIHTHRNRSPTSAIFLQSQISVEKGLTNDMIFLDLNKQTHSNQIPFNRTTFSHDPSHPDKVCILQSCNGLLLCRTGGFLAYREHPDRLFYYVYNPTTNQVATIDRDWEHDTTIEASVLVFDPTKSPHYKVVFCLTPAKKSNGPEVAHIEVYSSKTRTWKVSSQPPYLLIFGLNRCSFAYFKGCIYWKTASHATDVVLCYNVDEERLTTLSSPPHNPDSGLNFYIGESAGHLHIVETFPRPGTSLEVYELKSDNSGWFVKYKVDITQLSKDLREMTSNKDFFGGIYMFAVQSLVVGRGDEDAVLVLEIPGKYIVYNLVDQSWKEVCNYPQANNDWFLGVFRAVEFICPVYRAVDYIESLALV